MVQGEKKERDRELTGRTGPQKRRESQEEERTCGKERPQAGELLNDMRRLRQWDREFGSLDGGRERRPDRRRGRSRRRRGGGKGLRAAAILRTGLVLIAVAGLLFAGLRFYQRLSGSKIPAVPLESSREVRPETMGADQ